MDWSYVAGMIDGEGTIHIYRHAQKSKHVYVRVSIYNSHKGCLEEIQKFLADNDIIAHLNDRHRNKKHKISYTLVVNQKDDVLKYLYNILPYCIIKKRKVRAGIKLAKKLVKNGFHTRRFTEKEKIWIADKNLSSRVVAGRIGCSYRRILRHRKLAKEK